MLLYWLAEISHELLHFNGLESSGLVDVHMVKNFVKVLSVVSISSSLVHSKVSLKNFVGSSLGLVSTEGKLAVWFSGLLIMALESKFLNHFGSECVPLLTSESLWGLSLVWGSPLDTHVGGSFIPIVPRVVAVETILFLFNSSSLYCLVVVVLLNVLS